jgi:O-antigen/teichoic acid export membrane protein
VTYIKKNLVALLVSQVATWVISLFVLTVAPDYFGDEGFGAVTYALAYVGFFILAAGLGTSKFMTREVSRNHSIVGEWVFNTLVMKLILSLLLSAVAISLARLIGNTGVTLALIAIGCIGMVFTVLNEVAVGALGGMERMAKPALLATVQVYVASLGGLLVLFLGGGVVMYSLVVALAGVIPVVGNTLMLWPQVRGHLHIDITVWKIVAIGGLPLVLLSVLNLIYGTIDIPILKQIAGEDAVGWYGLAYRWASIPVFISAAVIAAFFPQFSAHGAAMTAEFTRLVNRAIRLVLFVAVPSAFGIALVAGDLIATFYDGNTYEPSVVLIQILAIHIPIAAMDTILGMSLIASDRQHKLLVLAGIAAVLNPVFCVFAIRATMSVFDNGAIGAAIVTVGTELFIMSGLLRVRSDGVMDRATVVAIVRCVAAGATMVPVLLLAGDLPLGVKVVAGVVCYVVASVAFGSISFADLQRAGRDVFETVGSIRARKIPAVVGDVGSEGGNVEGAHLDGDLYAEPGGQDRDRDPERVGE